MHAFAPRRTTEPQISDAITLGWRIATLYSLRADELPTSPPDNLHPMRRSLPAAERLVLELRAAAGDAGRLGIGPEPAELETLVGLAEQAPDGPGAEATFRDSIRRWHIHLQTMLWAEHEATGKAYELGSFLSDTSNRVVLELRRAGDPCTHVTDELREVFSARRVQRIERLLDDLQSRIDPAAARIVKDHLAQREAAVAQRTPDARRARTSTRSTARRSRGFSSCPAPRSPRRTSTTRIAPACAARCSRARCSYACNRRCTIGGALALAALAAIAAVAPWLVDQVDDEKIIAFAGPVLGALGVSLASVGRTVRKSLDARAELLWNTALVEVIGLKTLRVDELLPAPAARHAWRSTSAPARPAARWQTRGAA